MRTVIFKVNTSITAAALALALAGQAQAQDAQHDWQGFYVGASVGAGVSNARAQTSTVFDPAGYFAATSVAAIATDGMQKKQTTDVIGGLDAGYDVQSGNLVFGVVADISYYSSNARMSTTGVYPCCAPTAYTISQSVKTDWLATARARVGYAVSNKALLYATGGYAGVQAKYTASFTDTFATASESASKSRFMSGWTVGGGAEFKLSKNWSVQPEFLYAKFGKLAAPGGTLTAYTPAISFPTNTFTHNADLSVDVARVAVQYRF